MGRVEYITFACTDAARLAEFWSAALGGERRDLSASLDSEIVDRPGEGPDLLFKEQPKGTERDLPIHLDLSTKNHEMTVEQLSPREGSQVVHSIHQKLGVGDIVFLTESM